MQAASVPQRVFTASDFQLSQIALKDFAIIANLLDDVIGPIWAKAETFAKIIVGIGAVWILHFDR